MSAKNGANAKTSWLDKIKWAVIVAVVAASIVANNLYSHYSVTLRLIAFVVLALVLVAFALTTQKGKSIWGFMKDSRNELRKVVWPTRQETTQTTLIIAVVVVILALVLWGVDSLFAAIVRSIVF